MPRNRFHLATWCALAVSPIGCTDVLGIEHVPPHQPVGGSTANGGAGMAGAPSAGGVGGSGGDGGGGSGRLVVDIAWLRQPEHPQHPPVGSRVLVQCVVTAAYHSFVWCQNPSGGPYSGIVAYVGSVAPRYPSDLPVRAPHEVTIEGTYDEWIGQNQQTPGTVTQLVDPLFSYIGVANPVSATLVAPADVATDGPLAEAYESVLIRVEDVTVLVQNSDAPLDFDTFTITGNLQVTDDVIDSVHAITDLMGNDYPVGTHFSSISGIHTFSFDHFKLGPRSLSELVP